MPEITGSVAIDVAIGLAFVYFMFSLVCSAVNELVASALKWRAATLEEGVRSLLGDSDAATFYENSRIQALKDGDRKPSYIPARTFALTVLDTLAPDVAQKVADQDPEQPPSNDVIQEIKELISTIQHPAVKAALEGAVGKARTNLDEFRVALEQEFDQTMDRASGWYKRHTQKALIVIAVIVVVGFNADSFSIGSNLAKDEAVRGAVLAQAAIAVDEGPPAVTTGEDGADVDPIAETEDAFETLAERVDDVETLNLPLGWGGDKLEESTNSVGAILGKVGGLLFTVFALSLGAPFWFDLLNRFSNLRGAGKREETETPVES